MTMSARLSELFRPGLDTLIIYSYMYGPQMRMPRSSCTSILGGVDGEAQHIGQRVNFAVVAKSPLPRIREFASARGWRNLPLYSSEGTTYTQRLSR